MEQHIRVPYAAGWAEARPPAASVVELLEPADIPAGSEEDALDQILRDRGISSALSALTEEPAYQLTIIVNDATRPTPSGRVLSHLVSRGFLPLRPERGRIRVLVATGSHRPGGSEDARRILDGGSGCALDATWMDVLEWHEAKRAVDHVDVGRTSRGTAVSVDRRVVESSCLLAINSVEPHYFAGYTGGRKSLMPGVCSHGTIEANHKLALSREADVLRLKGNPVHEDAEEAVALMPLPPLVSLQLVLDRQQRIAHISCGTLARSFAEAVVEADRRYVAPIAEPADIVVSAAAPPMDYDLYQSQKAVENAARAVRDGGVLILVSSCRKGIGDRSYFDLLSSCPTPSDVRNSIEGCYVLGYHKANRLACAAERIHLLSVTGLPDAEMKAAFFEPFHSLQEAIDRAVALTGDTSRIAVLPDGCVTVPRVAPATGGSR